MEGGETRRIELSSIRRWFVAAKTLGRSSDRKRDRGRIMRSTRRAFCFSDPAPFPKTIPLFDGRCLPLHWRTTVGDEAALNRFLRFSTSNNPESSRNGRSHFLPLCYALGFVPSLLPCVCGKEFQGRRRKQPSTRNGRFSIADSLSSSQRRCLISLRRVINSSRHLPIGMGFLPMRSRTC
jgi:hypothetical protein